MKNVYGFHYKRILNQSFYEDDGIKQIFYNVSIFLFFVTKLIFKFDEVFAYKNYFIRQTKVCDFRAFDSL